MIPQQLYCLHFRSVNRYILGSGERMEVDVLVENDGEDSFETSYEMGVPLGLNYVNIERYDEGTKEWVFFFKIRGYDSYTMRPVAN